MTVSTRIVAAMQALSGSSTPNVPRFVLRDTEDLLSSAQMLYTRVRPYTMTNPRRIAALADAVRYVVGRGIPGAFAECGVWRGGSVLGMILTLQELGVSDRDLYLYDTFSGMSQPTPDDVSRFEAPALDTWHKAAVGGKRAWSRLFGEEVFGEEQVREMLIATGYPVERIHIVAGTVEETLPKQAPGQLALMRLDTDWYESTRHELQHLYPRLALGGVLIVDDYGHWDGCRKAVDEYFAADGKAPFLQRIDYSARMAVKC